MMLLVYTFILNLLLINAASELIVTITDLQTPIHDTATKHHSKFYARDISFEGSHIEGVAFNTFIPSHQHGDPWSIAAPLVYALPNQGSADGLMNDALVAGTIVLFDRDEGLSMCEQVHVAQHAGAIAAIIVDSPGGLHEQHTALRAAVAADVNVWRSLSIPAVIVRFERGERLKSSMALIKGDVVGHSNQYIMEESEFAHWTLHHHRRDDHTMTHNDHGEL